MRTPQRQRHGWSSVIALGLPLVLTSCHRSEKPSGGPFPELSAIPPPPPTTILLSGDPAIWTPLKTRMRDHALQGAAVRDAVARGDLAGARSAALKLAEPASTEAANSPLLPKLNAMIAAAGRVVDATDIDKSARALGALAESCGGCHSQYGGPHAPTALPPLKDTPPADVATRMSRHQWASTRLWEGLVAPSPDLWTRGARVLEDAPLEPERLTPGKTPVAKVGALAATVHDLGRKASAADNDIKRSEVYGELMSTCGTCHAWLGGGPK